ncbi:ribonuclease HII [Amylibacter sp.]|jgi:ribonuclease HII|nr:ribonuclease HII [Amylibacter sp.]MDA9300089.1 ribonuclease HII [Amylibacter sp.]MDB2320684.1 ribonuclease HII [Amylibacter sp.]MDB4080381.1 ribonuclease HII [Amylibacter sp.]MDB9785485.1 ribonuclease HII [Amylibacter sp.]|tara:strand:- start:328 stop:954 length:627 start_codon:yes stop_codon:yes gene_type:complete
MSDVTYNIEASFRLKGNEVIIGVDEVGRGPWAGPVTACAVILNPDNIPHGLNDSKKLNVVRRNELFLKIMESSLVSCVHVDVEEIDKINILQATFRAMERSILKLPIPDHILIDGNKLPPNLPSPATAIIKGDTKSASIAAASIIAKVTRDQLMANLSLEYPGYGWEKNAGYGTKMHQLGLLNNGVTPHHRRSFKPIHNMLYSASPRK